MVRLNSFRKYFALEFSHEDVLVCIKRTKICMRLNQTEINVKRMFGRTWEYTHTISGTPISVFHTPKSNPFIHGVSDMRKYNLSHFSQNQCFLLFSALSVFIQQFPTTAVVERIEGGHISVHNYGVALCICHLVYSFSILYLMKLQTNAHNWLHLSFLLSIFTTLSQYYHNQVSLIGLLFSNHFFRSKLSFRLCPYASHSELYYIA